MDTIEVEIIGGQKVLDQIEEIKEKIASVKTQVNELAEAASSLELRVKTD